MEVSVDIAKGDRGKRYAETICGQVRVVVYESLVEAGKVIVDIDADYDTTALAVTVNDGYVYPVGACASCVAHEQQSKQADA